MDTTTVSATNASQAAKGAAATGAQTQAEKDSTGNAFELMLRNMASRFKGAAATPIDANIARDIRTPEPKQADTRDDRSVQKDDTKDTQSTDKAQDRKDAKDAKDSKDDDTKTATDQAASASDAQDAAKTVQMAALQTQLVSTTTATPVAVVAQSVDQGPAVQAQADAQAQVVLADPTTQVATAVTAAVTQQAAAAPVVAQQVAQAVTDAKAETKVATQTENVVDTAPQTVVAEKVATTQVKAQTVATAQTEVVEDDTPKVTTHAEAKTQQTPVAKAQSESLSRLLGSQDQIKVAVTVDQAKAATPSINPYNHFVGYNMADNAGESLANGGAAQTETTALVAEDTSAAAVQPQAALAAVAASATTVTAPTPVTAAPVADTGVTAIGGASASENAGQSPSDMGQNGLGQSGLGNANGTNQANGTQATDAAKQTTPSQVFEQIKVHITRATKAGMDQVSIQLRPDDLGRVEVKLEMAHDGRVKATVIADNPQTLQLMQQDSHGLERALNDAGLRTDANSLEFSLRGDSSNNGTARSDGGSSAGGNGSADGDTTTADAQSFDYSRAANLRGGVDTYA